MPSFNQVILMGHLTRATLTRANLPRANLAYADLGSIVVPIVPNIDAAILAALSADGCRLNPTGDSRSDIRRSIAHTHRNNNLSHSMDWYCTCWACMAQKRENERPEDYDA